MGLKDYVTKKTIEKITNTVSFLATVKTLEHMEQKNAADSLAGKSKESKSANDKITVSQESFFEEPKINRLTMIEKTLSMRKSFTIKDSTGYIKYTAKSEGLPKMPQIGLYDKNSNRIGKVERGIFGCPNYTITYKNKTIATLVPKITMPPKFEIAENGWKVEGALTKTTVYDKNGDVAIQIRYSLGSAKDTIIIEYTNASNEVPAILIALAMVIFRNM